MIKLVIKRLPDRKKPCLVLESGSEGIILANFINEERRDMYVSALHGKNTIEIADDNRTIDDFIKEIYE